MRFRLGTDSSFCGLLGFGQREEDVVQVKDLTCRPCSVFGDKEMLSRRLGLSGRTSCKENSGKDLQIQPLGSGSFLISLL
jgi:hypothetical protein